MDISKTTDHIQIKIKMPNPGQETPESPSAPNEDLKKWMFFAHSKSRQKDKILKIGLSKANAHMQIIINM